MNRSRSELAAHLMKAARGAQLPLALAEDLYAVAPFLTSEDIAWIADDIEAGGQGLADLTLALDSAECGIGSSPSTPPAAAFAAARAWRSGGQVKMKNRKEPSTTPIEVADVHWNRLDVFAARTYVPETVESRASGAGAGEIDND